MRKIYLLLLAVLFSSSIFCQVILTEGFEGGTFPPTGWTRINDGAGKDWQSSKLATFTDGPYAAAFGTGCMVYEYDLNNPADAWMITPSIAMTSGSNYVIKFWYRVRLSTFPEKLKVTIGNAATTAAQSTTLWNNNGGASLNNATYTAATINHTAAATGNFFLGFNCYSDENQWALSVDSFSVEMVNPCAGTPPVISSVASVYNICTSGTSVLSFTGVPASTGLTYQWESSPLGANTFTNVSGGTGATTTSYTSASLAASTDFRCKVTCTNGGAFSYSTITSVSVSPGVPSNDLVCNATPLSLNGAVINENTICATATGDPAYSQSTPNNTIWYSFTPASTGVYNLEMTRPTGLQGGFLNGWLGIYTATGTCPTLSLTEVPSSLPFNLTTGSSYTLVTPSLTAGTTYYFMIDGFSSAFGSFGIKIISAPAAPTCVTNISPINGATAVTAPVANISWNATTNATGYDVMFGTANPPTSNLGTTSATTINITGLAINTTYYWYIVPRGNGGAATGCISNVTSFTTDGVLPVTFASFSGKKEGRNNILSWSTANELNNKGFEILRSADGKNFSSIGFEASKNNTSTTATNYSFVDEKVLSGANYYQLKQIDKDGKSSLSNIVVLKSNTNKLEISTVYPNPANDKLNAIISSDKEEKVTVSITDLAGKVVSSQQVVTSNGSTNVFFNLQGLSKGAYLLRLTSTKNNEIQIEKFVKQ